MPTTDEQLRIRNYRRAAIDAATSNSIENISHAMAWFLHNAHGSPDHLREVITDNSLADLAAARYASCQSGYSPLDLSDNIASVPISTPDNAVFSFSRESLLRKLKEDCRREELEQIKILRSIKATIRYIVEIK